MKALKIFLYILAIPLFLYLALFFEYLSFFSLLLLLSVFLFRDLKIFNFFWFLLIVSVLLDVSLHLWLGTYLSAITFVLFLLMFFDKFVSNIFLDLIAVFFAFILFKIFFSSFIFFQETGVLINLDLGFLLSSFVFAFKNLFVYMLLKFLQYILKAYFRDNIFNPL